MIQRKQSVFLLLAAIASTLIFFFPLANFIGAKGSFIMFVHQIQNLVPDSSNPYSLSFILPLLSANAFVIIFSLLTIFLYKNRKVQMKITKLNILLEVIFIGLFFLYYVDVLEKASGATASYGIGVFMPMLSLILLVFAYRGIVQDERLIRSADRLR